MSACPPPRDTACNRPMKNCTGLLRPSPYQRGHRATAQVSFFLDSIRVAPTRARVRVLCASQYVELVSPLHLYTAYQYDALPKSPIHCPLPPRVLTRAIHLLMLVGGNHYSQATVGWNPYA
jgi:hypothetical protein